MKEKIQQKGFIQISILIGILVFGAIATIGTIEVVKHKEEIQSVVANIVELVPSKIIEIGEVTKEQPEENEVVEDISESNQPNQEPEKPKSEDQEIEGLKKEIENLKKQLLKTPQPAPQPQSQNLPQKDLSQQTPKTNHDTLPRELLEEIMRRVVQVTCSGSFLGTVNGSGILLTTAENDIRWVVWTNAHVAVAGPPEENSCIITLPEPPDYSLKNDIYPVDTYISVSHKYPDVDLVTLFLHGRKGFKWLNEILPICKTTDVSIGDEVTIFGYPAFGGRSLTITDGIISGFQNTQYGYIYKTSAKIDKGNSGGLAINNNKQCSLGMPTWGVEGAFGGLAYIQSWDMMDNAFE